MALRRRLTLAPESWHRWEMDDERNDTDPEPPAARGEDSAALLPADLRSRLPRLYATEALGDPVVHAKLFTPWTSWTWFLTEFDGEDTCFGLVSGHEIELGYLSLGELEAIRGPGGLRIERDIHFTPKRLSEVRADLERERPHGLVEDKGIDNGRRRTFNGAARSLDSGGTENAAATLSGASPETVARRMALPSPLETPAIRMLETGLATPEGSRAIATVARPRDAALVLQSLIGDADREHFVALYLNARHELTHAHIVSRGTAQSSLVHPREVFKAAVLANAAAVVVGHNHPSGDVQPSAEDRAVLERLKNAGELMGIGVLDAIIVGPKRQFYAASTDEVLALPPAQLDGEAPQPRPDFGRPSDREVHLELICHGLLKDIDEVLERQGEEWWDETVTSGTYHRDLAERCGGVAPYRPLPDAAESGGPV